MSGFSLVSSVAGEQRVRWTGEEARFRLPVDFKHVRRLCVSVYTRRACEVELALDGGQLLGSFSIRPQQWQDLSVEVRGEGPARFVLRTPFDPEGKHYDYRNLAVRNIEAEIEGAEITTPMPPWEGLPHHEREVMRFEAPFRDYKVFYGDPHVHTNFSLCDYPHQGSVRENVEYCRDELGLDFAALADHAEHMDDKQYDEYRAAWDEFNLEGSFVMLPAYEWTSEVYGHRNLYFLDTEMPRWGANSTRSDTPEKLTRLVLERTNQALVVPHHSGKRTFPQRWRTQAPLERCAEIYSKWGSFEYYGNALSQIGGTYDTVPGLFIQDALTMGKKMGFLAGGDCHILKPGTRGLTGVLARELTRSKIFEALMQRRTFATTGVRSEVFFTLNGHLMGEEIVVNRYQLEKMYPFRIYVEISSPAPIDRVELLQNNVVVFTQTVSTTGGYFVLRYSKRGIDPDAFKQFSFTYIPPQSRKFHFNHSYYVRITHQDKHMTWSSPIWIMVKDEE
jgi:hypothetical protein